MDEQVHRVLRFDRFALDLTRGCLRTGDQDIDLRPKTFEVLRHLAENAGRLVLKQELHEAVWPNVVVSDDSLVQCIRELRQKLGDDEYRLIKTVSRRGYLLDAAISAGDVKTERAPQVIMPPAAVASVRSGDAVDKIDRDVLPGERKQVTVLCADFKRSLELVAERDPEEALKVYEAVLKLMRQAIHRYDGAVNLVTGDGVMALFGVPLSHEDHAVRACYAALQIQEAVTLYAQGLQRPPFIPLLVRAGLNSGEVVIRSIASGLPAEFRAMGEATHLAARLGQLATPGTSLVSAETLRLAEGHVQVKMFEADNINRLGEPVYELVGSGPPKTRFQARAARRLTRFVGRDGEMDRLRQALERARIGHGQVVAVVGEPGVGKSRLYWEFTHSHGTQGWRALESGSVSYGKATAFLPIIDLLRAYFQIEARDEARKIRERVTAKLLSLDRALEPSLLVPIGNQNRVYSWCSPPRIGLGRIRPTACTARGIGASLPNDKCVRVPL